jgi:F0F1-type ATP synthase membrane subunit c/vacuolar-type H+-ATPase subunit K
MKTLPVVGAVIALIVPSIASAHHVQPGALPNAQTVPWLVVVLAAALVLFALVVGGALVLRLVRHRRRLPVAAPTHVLLTSTMAGCAVIALVAFVATQFIDAVPRHP